MFHYRAIRITMAVALVATSFLPSTTKSEATDSDRLQKLEQAVLQLQQRNAQLEAEVKSLKKERPVEGAAPPAEGPTKTKGTYDGKTYVEKSVPVEKSAADKWKLSTALTELEIFGDARVRYEYRGGRTADDVANPNDWQERRRERYRLRLGLRGTLLDDWFFGVRLETSTNPRSTNITFGDDTAGNGPFAKNSDGINVGQAYVGYQPIKDIKLVAGKLPNPFVTTLMVWDADINPEGATEQWKHTFKIMGSSPDTADMSYSKDGKAVAANKPEPIMTIDVFANFGQFIYDDLNPENPVGPSPAGVPENDAWLLGWQVGARFKFPNNLYFELAPTLYNYTGNGDTFNTHFVGDPGTNQTGINSLLVFELPAEFGWKMWNLPIRLFGDFAVNLEASDRAAAALHPDKDDQRYAYQAGLGVGQLKKKGNWQVNAFWQHTEQYSVDPNLVDSDLFDSRVNVEGVAVQAGYALTDAVTFNLTYGYGWRIDSTLGTGGTGDIGINPLDHYQLFQADLNWKF